MSRKQVITPSIENRITDDWLSVMPSLARYKARHLLRRVGPLVMGVLLERDSSGDIYLPCSHVHFLGREFSVVTLTLGVNLRSDRSGGQDFIEVALHADRFREAAERMARQSLLPLAGDVRIDQVLGAYQQFVDSRSGRASPALLSRDMILLLAWAHKPADADALMEEMFRVLGDDESVYRHVGGREGFEGDCREAIENPETIDRTIKEQIVALGLENLPVSELLV